MPDCHSDNSLPPAGGKTATYNEKRVKNIASHTLQKSPAGRLCALGSNVSRGLPTAPFKAATPAVILARPTGFQGRAASLPGSNARGTLRGTQPEKSLFGG